MLQRLGRAPAACHPARRVQAEPAGTQFHLIHYDWQQQLLAGNHGDCHACMVNSTTNNHAANVPFAMLAGLYAGCEIRMSLESRSVKAFPDQQ